MDIKERRLPEYYLELLDKQKRGKLKIYLGYAVGVGKTYEMLNEGHRLLENGKDVVIGYLEPHKRKDIFEKAKGLEVIPQLIVPYKGLSLGELDVDAVIKRHPGIALVDEIAHTNATGSRNQKRYQDVEELLKAGVDIIATLNIQHLESLRDIVKMATGLNVAERVPDEIVAQADGLLNVDIEAEELIERLKAGKIYAREMIQTALDNLFTVPRLNQLREILFSEMAFMLDNRQHCTQSKFTTPNNLGRAVVALSGDSANLHALVRKAYRLATRLGSEWYIVYTSKQKKYPSDLSRANNLELAKSLGAKEIALEGKDTMSALINFLKEKGVTHLVIERPATRGIRDLFQRSDLENLMRNLPGVDIIIG